MKTFTRILLFTLAALSLNKANGQTFFSEGFESGTKPAGWSEIYVSGTEPWKYRNGGHSPDDNNWQVPPEEEDITRNPPHAHSGTYNAIFFKQSTNHEKTKLVTKVIDLSQAIKPELSFWLCQVPWTFSGNTNWDYLRVYYKTSFSSDWVLLAEYTDPISEWTQFKINLPNPTSTYYLAFEGETNWGFGTCIDDIEIIETGFQERYVSELVVDQADYTFVPSGSKDEPILKIGIKVFGNTGTATLKALVAKSLNTNDEDIESNGVKLYFTETAAFNTDQQLSTSKDFANGTVTFNNINYNLPNGQSYLWLTYDVKQNATHGNILDAMLETGSIQVSDSLYPKTNESPIGERTIYETIYRQDFEGAHGWALNGEFEVDTPKALGGVSLGYPDPSEAFSGGKVLGTDLNGLGSIAGDYENHIDENSAYTAVSPKVDALFYKDMKISFRRYLNIEVWDKAYIDVSKDNGTTWGNVWYNNNYFTDNTWQKAYHDVDASISRSNELRFRYKLGPTDQSSTYSGWNIDDFIVTGDHITKDVGVVEWVYPLSGCGHSESDSVIIKVANMGAEASPSSIPVQYSFDNGTTWVTNFINQSIPAGDTITYTFSTKVNLSEPGPKYVKARTRLNGDEDESNNEISAQVYVVPTYTLPYSENFIYNDGYWQSFGNGLWEWGTISKPSAISGDKAWMTSLSKNYGEALESSQYDTLYYDEFEEDLGWTLTGEFEIDTPAFVSDTIPYYAYSGVRCLSTDLTRKGSNPGMYEPNATYTATSPEIAISNYAALRLIFLKWYKVAEGDTIKVLASNNGTDWTTIWNNNGSAIALDNWYADTINIPGSLTNATSLKVRFMLIANSDANVGEGINIEDFIVEGKQFADDAAYLQSPCFDFSGISKPIFDLKIFNHTETNVDGATLYYSTDKGETWTHVNNPTSYDDYFNWYTDSTVSALGKDGWNGIGTQWERTRHQLPNAIAGKSNVIFRIVFKSDRANNNFNGTAIDSVNLYEAPFDVGVVSILNPATTCQLSDKQNVQVRIKNFGVRNLLAGDTILVALDISHTTNSDSFVDTLVLSSPLNTGTTLDHTYSRTFDMSVSGDYNLTAYTKIEQDPVFYSASPNDTATALVTVQKPHVELGPDIWTLQPDTVVLDATNPDPAVTYKWYKDPDYTTVLGTNATYAIPDHNGGKFVSLLENAIPCTATDTIVVHRLIRDAGVPEFDSPVSSCELSDKTPIKVYVKNYGTDTLNVGDTIKLHYVFNGGSQIDTTWVMDKQLLPSDSLIFVFSDSLDMQATGSYTLRVWANVWLDESSANDETNETINVWGYPTFSLQAAMGLPDDTVKVFNTVYTLDAGSGWDAYLWHNDNSTNQTYDSKTTEWGVVTVYDSHNCPATDSVFVDLRFSDVSVDSVLVPRTACESNGTIFPRIYIRNTGTDTITSGTNINLKYYLNGVLKDSPTLTLSSDWNPDDIQDIIFGVGVDISAVGTYDFDFVANTPSDNKPENDSIRHTISIYGYPSIDIGDTIYTRNSNYTLDAGAGRDSYSWSTGETEQQITVSTTGKYTVEVVENSMCSSKDSVEVIFLNHDYSVNQIVNPVTSCSKLNPQTIRIKYSNVGNDTLKTGEQVTFGYQIDDKYFAQENHTLTTDLVPGQFILYDFNEKIDLSQAGSYNMTAYGIYSGDSDTSNDTLTTAFDIKEAPHIDLGEDRVDRTGNLTLDGSEGTGFTYLWQDNSTNRFYIVENSGQYYVTTSAPNGCSDQDTVNITMLKPDYRVSAIPSPVSACSLSETESIQVEIENAGTDTLYKDQNLFVSYEINGAIQETKSLTMTSNFVPGAKITHTFATTYDFSKPGTYTIKAYTTYNGDLNPYNNSVEKTVDVYGKPSLDLGADRGFCTGSSLTLDAGAGLTGYLWNTGATSQTIEVTTGGQYHISVTDSHGCSNKDTVEITENSLPDVTHASIDPVCLDADPFTLTGGSPSGGSYSGSGVSGSSFTASVAGVGTHAITYTYTDGNGCSNSANVDIKVNPLPTVDLGGNRSTTEPIVLDAGAGFASYRWQDNSTNQTYNVESTGTYSVTVTDANGCSATDQVKITFLESVDVIVSNLISPTDKCYNNESDPVTVELTNRGTKTFKSGDKINVAYQIGSANPVSEEYTLTGNLAQNDKVNYTFSNNVNLSTGTFTFQCYTTIEGDNGEKKSYDVTIHDLPNLDLGPDTLFKSVPYVLQSGIGNVTYQWNTGSTAASITVSQHGTYWLTVTDGNGCSASDTIVIWWPTGVVDHSDGSSTITVYPNPASSEVYVTIETKQPETFTIELLSTQGAVLKQIETPKATSGIHKFGVGQLAPGLYFIRVTAGNKSSIVKLIVRR